MSTIALLSPFPDDIAGGKLSDRCHRLLAFFSDSVSRLPSGLNAAVMVLLHVIFALVLVAVDADYVTQRAQERPWYFALYFVLLVVSLVQVFFTYGSSPGYVIDAMRVRNGNSVFVNTHCFQRNLLLSTDILERDNILRILLSWEDFVEDLYPPGSYDRRPCNKCDIAKPPRAKHCYDCDKCVLRYDHHCVWLGTCIGQGNRCRYWWYLLEETVLCSWTGILYVMFLQSNPLKAWWKNVVVTILLAILLVCLIFLLHLLLFHSYLALTGQTTYEVARRQRISYLRGIPGKVHPYSKGIRRNLYELCRSGHVYDLDAVPGTEEVEARARPYSSLDIISCRCC